MQKVEVRILPPQPLAYRKSRPSMRNQLIPQRLPEHRERFSGQRGYEPRFWICPPHLSARGTSTLLNNALLRAHCPVCSSHRSFGRQHPGVNWFSQAHLKIVVEMALVIFTGVRFELSSATEQKKQRPQPPGRQ